MTDKRKLERKDLLFYGRVFDKKRGELIGHLVNITPGGAMLVSDSTIEAEVSYELSIELPESIAGKDYLECQALCVWCAPDINPEFYGIGFKFVNPSQQDIEIINRMIAEYSLTEESRLMFD